MRFKDKVVVVTGAGSGIGEGIAEEFGKEGAIVAIAEINSVNGRKVEEKLKAQGIQAAFFHVDISDENSVLSAVQQIHDQFGRIDVLINNAGVSLWRNILDTTTAEWDKIMGVNLKGLFLMSKHCASYIKLSDVRSIVNISSVHANLTLAGVDAYVASKGGILSLTRSMALSLRELKIRVNGICPGYIETPMTTNVLEAAEDSAKLKERFLSFHLADRLGTAKDIGRVCMFLSSEDAAFINGHIMVVDGGVSIQLPNRGAEALPSRYNHVSL